MMGCKFKVGDAVFYSAYGYGYGIVLKASPYSFTIDFGKHGIRPLNVSNDIRLATEADKDWPPPPPNEAEPCDLKPTLEALAKEITSWELAINYYGKTYDNDDEYDHEIYIRYCLHGTLNGLKAAKTTIPNHLATRLKIADAQFITITRPSPFIGRGYNHCDETAFWYYYRFPNTFFNDIENEN